MLYTVKAACRGRILAYTKMSTSATKINFSKSSEFTKPVLQLRTAEFKRPDLSKVETREGSDISSVFNTLGTESNNDVFPPRFVELKKKLIKNPEAVKESWVRLKKSLKEKIDQIEKQGPDIVPSIDYNELETLNHSKRADVLEKGCVVVRNVFSREEGRKFKTDVDEYVKANPQTKGFPQDKKVVYELYWSKSQVRARSDPRMIKTLNFVNHLWHADEKTEISLDQNLSYADRLRIRNAGDNMFSLGPHADGGGVERWEDEEYSRCYDAIFEGRWEDYDPFDATHRAKAQMSLYPTAGACRVFRTFQGWLSMSDAAPGEGTILFGPFVKEVTAYYMLRPFFDENDELDFSTTKFPGTVIGKAQEFNDKTHPDLDLQKLMVSIPKVQPGDAVFWHCDLIHAVDPVHKGTADSSVMYIPSVPLCELNARYFQLQRESFLNGFAGPDFPGFPSGVGEREHVGRADATYAYNVGGRDALQELCLEPFDVKSSYSEGTKSVIKKCNDILFQR